MNKLHQLQQHIPTTGAILLSSPGDIRYFSSFEFLVPHEREALLLVSQNSATLLHASFSPVNAPAEIVCVPGCYPSKLKAQVMEIVRSEKINSIAIDKETLYVNEFDQLEAIDNLEITELNRANIWELRSIKSEEEIGFISKAAEITHQVIHTAIKNLKTGISELEVEELIEAELKKAGSPSPAFPTIVAFGENTALPHHQPTHLELKENTPVLIDAGATFRGYCADMTRTVWFGKKPSRKFKQIEKIVKEAYQAAFSALAITGETKRANDIDSAARTVIKNAGYADKFIHTTGHSLGLDIHEQPSLSWANSDGIRENMVLTVEPGIYLERELGYRHENTVLAKNEPTELTTKKLSIIS